MGGSASVSSCKHLFIEKWGNDFHCCDCHGNITSPDHIQDECRIVNGILDNSAPEDAVNRGVTIQFLVDFTNLNKCWNMTTREVRRKFVMPATRSSRCRFVELPEMSSIVGKATTFVSHTWGAKFGDLVAALCDGDADRSRIVWVDIFAVRQWPSQKPDLDFSAVVRQCKSFLIVCSFLPEVTRSMFNKYVTTLSTEEQRARLTRISATTRSQIAFLRVWCLVEIHTAISCGCTVVIKGGSYNKWSRDVQFRPNSFLVYAMESLIDIESADATMPSDKERILSDIESGVGISEVNRTIKKLLESTHSEDEKSAVVQCAACGDVKALQKINSAPNMYLESVCAFGYLDILKSIVNHCLPFTDDGYCAFLTIGYGGIECLKVLLDNGYDVNKRYGNFTPLMEAVCKERIDCATLLISRHCDINAICESKTFKKWTALMFAAKYNKANALKLLIESGCDINITNDEGKTALMIACENRCCETAKLLILGGCDVNIKDNKGCTALDIVNNSQDIFSREIQDLVNRLP